MVACGLVDKRRIFKEEGCYKGKVQKMESWNNRNKKRLYCCSILAGMFWSIGLPAWGDMSCEETVVVSCSPGSGPGQYVYRLGAGYDDSPMCFGIDSNDGTFYIPEVDSRPCSRAIRVHKFDANGTFIGMLKPEGRTDRVRDIVIGTHGDLYLELSKPGIADCTICRYDRHGRLLNQFGAKGPFTQEDLGAEKKAEETGDPYCYANRDKYFRTAGRLVLIPNDELLFVRGYDVSKQAPETFRFAGRTGQLLEHVKKNANLAAAVAEKRSKYIRRHEQFLWMYREEFGQGTKAMGYSLIGPDGQFYYMSVTPERLEIRRVVFSD